MLKAWLDTLRGQRSQPRVTVPIQVLHYARSVGKRLDEHREVVEAIEKHTTLLKDRPWHIGHLSIQDDYLMRLYQQVYGVWPDHTEKWQSTGEWVRPRPAILGRCRLSEYPKEEPKT